MRKNMILLALAGVGLALQGCGPRNNKKTAETATEQTATTDNATQATSLSECRVDIGGLTFSHALNGGDTCVSVVNDSTLLFRCTEGRDFFRDPNDGKLSNHTLPALFTEVDNTRPFTLTAKVTPEFTAEGLYNAADLLVYANDSLWQKLCFEQDERGNHRIVSVRTQGTSDDNNHEQVAAPAVYLKLSSDTRTLASYYSLDQKEWHMVRLYKNYYPARIWVGIASQCPKSGTCNSLFESISLQQTSVSDFRMGD